MCFQQFSDAGRTCIKFVILYTFNVYTLIDLYKIAMDLIINNYFIEK